MWFVYFFIFVTMLYVSVIFRLIVLHPAATAGYSVKDFYNWLVHKGFNYFEAGHLDCYMAHFGKGKTLSMAHEIVRIFTKYNNKPVWDRGRKKFVIQKIHVIANFELKTIPFEPLASLSQVVACAEMNKGIDLKNNTRTVVLVAIDEASAQLNSRSFKTNIDPLFLNTLLTSRHYHISIMYSSQKFKLTDALLRSVTQRCISCNKCWRFMVQSIYNADEMEYASDPTLVKPIRRTGFFIKDKDYAAYDTLAVVSNLKKSVDKGDMMTEEQILAMRGDMNPDNDAVTDRSFKHKMRKRR